VVQVDRSRNVQYNGGIFGDNQGKIRERYWVKVVRMLRSVDMAVADGDRTARKVACKDERK
jgi:hypothetical protein